PSGYKRFSEFSQSCRPTLDVLEQVTYSVSACVGVTTGACCAAAGSCSSTTQAGCTGTYRGDNTVCSPNPCPQPSGACCATGATVCTVTTQPACAGTFVGVGAACTGTSCSGA